MSLGERPGHGVSSDNFSARWTRMVTFEAGTYRFRATVDDGARLFVDGVLVIDEWRDGAQREVTGVRALAAGLHSFVISRPECDADHITARSNTAKSA